MSSDVIYKVLMVVQPYKVSINGIVVEVFVEKICKQIQVFAFLNDLLRILDYFSEAVHNFLAVFMIVAVV